MSSDQGEQDVMEDGEAVHSSNTDSEEEYEDSDDEDSDDNG